MQNDRGGAAKVARPPWTAAKRRDRPPHARVLITGATRRRSKSGLRAMMTADNGVTRRAELHRLNLAMVKGGGLEKDWTNQRSIACKGGQKWTRKRVTAIGAPRVDADAGHSVARLGSAASRSRS